MPWVKFVKDFDFNVKYGVTKAYKAGMVENVTRRCAAEAAEKEAVENASRPKNEASENHDD